MSDKDKSIFLTEASTCTEHSFTDLVRFNNGCSVWGDKLCQKCGATYSWQYDYETQHHSMIGTTPF